MPWADGLRADGRAAGRDLARAAAEASGAAEPQSLAGALVSLAAGTEAIARLRAMLDGIDRYQSHPYRRTLQDPPTVWSLGRARLLDYGRAPEAIGGPGAPGVLVIPSLVNRAAILDLHPRRSLMRALAARGLRPLLLDWGDPGAAERRFDLDAYYVARALPAARAAAALTGAPVAALGYCMGGAFAAALAAQRPGLVSRLALIGAPWEYRRFEGMAAALASLVGRDDPTLAEARIRGLGEAFGSVPSDFLQLLFAALDPTLALRKFRRFAQLPPDSDRAEMFVAVEDWLNDGVALAAPAARDIALDWYRDNRTSRGDWRLGGEAVWPAAVSAPTLAFCSPSDRIAPPACAEPLPRAIPGARILRPRTGHVGMIVGSCAPREVWGPLIDFLRG
ncbi:MAG: alpha/beta fold hydrolase [Pseudomonadota bacterium]